MKKVYVQVIDTKSEITQSGIIEEPVKKGLEIQNALLHFGVSIKDVEWIFDYTKEFNAKFGKVVGTTKVITIVNI